MLCKENTTRLIRYAGYGNCAGFLASRGLMIPSVTHTDGEYSEDELSDVEDSNDMDVMTGHFCIFVYFSDNGPIHYQNSSGFHFKDLYICLLYTSPSPRDS